MNKTAGTQKHTTISLISS